MCPEGKHLSAAPPIAPLLGSRGHKAAVNAQSGCPTKAIPAVPTTPDNFSDSS